MSVRRLPLLIAAGCLVGLSACSAPLVISINGHPVTGPALPPAQLAPAPAEGGFDAAHVAAVAGPAVATLVVGSRPGVAAEGSAVAFKADARATDLVTNDHVVAGGGAIQVLAPDGRRLRGSLVGADEAEDLAVVRVPASLPLIHFGDSTQLTVGQPVAALGSPFGQQGTLTTGVISALHQPLTDVGDGRGNQPESLPDVLQTDAPINPGNSGGALLDADGRLIGITTAGTAGGGRAGFAIPSAIVQRVTGLLLAGRQATDPYLGVCTVSVQDAMAQGETVDGNGAVVEGVISGGPAARAGLRAGDVIHSVAGTQLDGSQTLGGALQLHNPGDQVSLGVNRADGPASVEVRLGTQPAAATSC